MEHTANQLRQWAKEPDLGVKSFANSILSTSRSICIPYQGVLLDRTSNPWEGFVFRAKSCSRNCSNRKRCSHCALKINVAIKVRESFVSIDKCTGKQASITKILSNLVLVAMEICMAREEIRHLHCELARTVLQEAIEKDGAVLLDGAAGNQIRRAVGIMDGPVTKALQLGAVPEALELWWVHTEHINRVFVNGGKGRGHQNATYHPKLMNWAIAFLAHTSSGTYNKWQRFLCCPISVLSIKKRQS
jgi:hypothetical protein